MISSEPGNAPSIMTAAASGQHEATLKDDDTDFGGCASPQEPDSAQTVDEPSTTADGGLEDTGQEDNGVTTATQNPESEKGLKPSWSDMKTKAGKERKRLPLACISCRRKKIRCSGEKPACNHCSRSRVPCVYKITTKKAAPRTDYMTMLDKRLKRMEERVIKAIPKNENKNMAAIGRAVVKPSGHKKRSATEAFGSEMEQWAAGESELEAKTPALVPDHGKLSGRTSLLLAGAEFLPSREIQEHLAEVFFDCIYGQTYMVLHKPSFIRRLKAGTIPPVLILAVCAVSARFSTHPQVSSEPPFLRGQHWAEPAGSIVLSRHDEPNITVLTVFLLLGLHEFGTCHGGRSWSFGGQALRMAYALQLHRELDYDPVLSQKSGNGAQLSFTDREIRRRIMWACFLMDRHNSSGSQRPPMGNESFLQIQLPIREPSFQMEIPGPTEDLNGNVPNPVSDGIGQLSNAKENMGVAAYVIRATVLWGRIVDYLNLGGMKRDPYPIWSPESEYTRLKKQVEDFSTSLPMSLIFTYGNLQVHAAEKVANQFLYLHTIINQNMLFLNQFSVPLSPDVRPPKDMPKKFLSDAGRSAVEAAHHIALLIKHASSCNLTAPYTGYCAYSASTVHIWGVFSKNAQLEARSKEDLRHTYRYLNKMKRYWGMFHYMVQSVKDRYRHFADAALRGSATNQDGQAAPIFQYGDWFDKYPFGVSRVHWEDPNPKDAEKAVDDAVMGQKPDLQSVEHFFSSLFSPNTETPQEAPTSPGARLRRKRNNNILLPETIPGLDLSRNPGTVLDGTMVNSPAVMEPTSAPGTAHPQPLTSTSLYSQDPFQIGQFPFNLPTADQLPQIDRQFVYDGAFTGLDLTAFDAVMDDNNPPNPPIAPVDGSAGEPSLWNATGQSDPTVPSGTGEFYQPSAWFLPFNLDPSDAGTGLGNVDPGIHGGLPGGEW